MTMEQKVRVIYVALLGAGPERWQQVEAIHEGDDAYRIISVDEHAEGLWEYSVGESVRCRSTHLPSGERVLVATERLNPSQPSTGDEEI
jgi:hypothetical protein